MIWLLKLFLVVLVVDHCCSEEIRVGLRHYRKHIDYRMYEKHSRVIVDVTRCRGSIMISLHNLNGYYNEDICLGTWGGRVHLFSCNFYNRIKGLEKSRIIRWDQPESPPLLLAKEI